MSTFDESDVQGEIKFIPTIRDFILTYANKFDSNDQKAVKVYKMYESAEKTRRLQGELMALKNGRIAKHVCDNAIGRTRPARHQSYEHWAELMLIWISQKN